MKVFQRLNKQVSVANPNNESLTEYLICDGSYQGKRVFAKLLQRVTWGEGLEIGQNSVI